MNKKYKSGYSIAEIIVYLAVFTLLSITVINSFIVVLGSYNNTRTNRDLLESGSAVIERVSREIRQAKNIDVVNSTLASSPGVLQLNSTTSGGTAMVIKFSVTSGALNLYQDGTLIGNLLGQNVSATALIFRRIVTTNGEAVKIELTLQDTRSKTSLSANFYDTIILRGAY
ncbi:MAG: hypothetical protein AAB477_00725 [Patescibacteria group bacterium]